MTGDRPDGARASDILKIRSRVPIVIGAVLVIGGVAMLCLPVFGARLDAGDVAGLVLSVVMGAVAIAVALRLRCIVIDDDALTYRPAGVSIPLRAVARVLPPTFDSIDRERAIRLEMKQAALWWCPLRYHGFGTTLHISLFGVDKPALYQALESRIGRANE